MWVDEQTLKDAFDYAREHFFPRWYNGIFWRVELTKNLRTWGRCCPELKTIRVFDWQEGNNDELLMLLIHEICHAVTNSGHAKLWCARMLQAAAKARKIGRHTIAVMIEEDTHPNTIPFKAEQIYREIEEWVIRHPSDRCEAVVDSIACRWGLYPQELEKRFTRCAHAYLKAQQEIQRDAVSDEGKWQTELD